MTGAVLGRLEALVRPRGTRDQRSRTLVGGLLLGGTINYLDLTGSLGLALEVGAVNWLGIAWLLLHLVAMDSEETRAELGARLRDLVAFAMAVVVLLAWAAIEHPDASVRYLSFATPTGQMATGLGQVVLPALLAAVAAQIAFAVLDWWSNYRYLSRTTPEERVLEDDSRS